MHKDNSMIKIIDISKIKEKLSRQFPEAYYLFRKYFRPNRRKIEFRNIISIDHIIREYLIIKKDIFFIQVGANDGKSFDPIYKWVTSRKWKGILIEPLPHLVEKLKQNYDCCLDKLCIEQVAISDLEEEAEIYYIPERYWTELPTYARGLSGLDKDRNELRYFSEYIDKEKVECVTLESIVKKHQINDCDLLVIDAEGYDLKVLKSLNLWKLKPKIIYLEYFHLTQKEKKETMSILVENDYQIMTIRKDLIAIANEICF